MRPLSKAQVVVFIHLLICFGSANCQGPGNDTQPETSVSTESSSVENTSDASSSTEIVPSTSTSTSTEEGLTGNQNSTVGEPLNDAGFFGRLYRRAKLALLTAFPVYSIVAFTGYIKSIDECEIRSDDFWLQQYCLYGHFIVLILLLLFAPVWFIIGPILFFIFDFGSEEVMANLLRID